MAQQKIDEARDILRPHVDSGDLNALLERLDVSSPKNGTYFWSRYPDGALTKAEQIAAKNGGISLESTPGVTIVNNWDALNESPMNNDFWAAVSKKYASGAEGKVEVIQSDKAFAGGGGKVWKETELPTLVKEGKVDQITLRNLDGNVREVWDKTKMTEMSKLYNGGH